MQKKAVASLQTGSKKLTKVIKMTKKYLLQFYTLFLESIISPDLANEWFNKIIFLLIIIKLNFTRSFILNGTFKKLFSSQSEKKLTRA